MDSSHATRSIFQPAPLAHGSDLLLSSDSASQKRDFQKHPSFKPSEDAFFFFDLLPEFIENPACLRNAVNAFPDLRKLRFRLIQCGLKRLLLLIQAVGLDSHQDNRDGENQRDPAKFLHIHAPPETKGVQRLSALNALLP